MKGTLRKVKGKYVGYRKWFKDLLIDISADANGGNREKAIAFVNEEEKDEIALRNANLKGWRVVCYSSNGWVFDKSRAKKGRRYA